ncbi:T9SS type A sorting domain-containing protein, partial [bacterium]|nr:T9SS type A sorting domain-containing protein [bacterium]
CDSWTEQILDFFRPICIETGDMDTDGTDEILGGSDMGYYLRWWEPIEYKEDGNLVSSILDIEDTTADWGEINWTVDLAPDTDCTVDVRSSGDYTDMGGWAPVDASGDDLSEYINDGDRYFQYRVSLSTQDTGNSPHFREIEVNWLIPTAPILVATEPYDNEFDVPVDFRVLLAFDVEMDPDPSLLQFTCEPDPGGWEAEWTTYNRIALLTHDDFEFTTDYTFELVDAVSKYGLHLGGSTAPNPFDFTTEDESDIALIGLSAALRDEGVLIRWDYAGELPAGVGVLGCVEGESPENLHRSWLPSTARTFLHRDPQPGSTMEYWVEVLDAHGVVHRFGPTEEVPIPAVVVAFSLEDAYPDPARDEVHLRYSIPYDSWVNLTVYDLSGRRVAVLVEGHRVMGHHHVVWDCGSTSGGIYFYRLESDSGSLVKRLAISR